MSATPSREERLRVDSRAQRTVEADANGHRKGVIGITPGAAAQHLGGIVVELVNQLPDRVVNGVEGAVEGQPRRRFDPAFLERSRVLADEPRLHGQFASPRQRGGEVAQGRRHQRREHPLNARLSLAHCLAAERQARAAAEVRDEAKLSESAELRKCGDFDIAMSKIAAARLLDTVPSQRNRAGILGIGSGTRQPQGVAVVVRLSMVLPADRDGSALRRREGFVNISRRPSHVVEHAGNSSRSLRETQSFRHRGNRQRIGQALELATIE